MFWEEATSSESPRPYCSFPGTEPLQYAIQKQKILKSVCRRADILIAAVGRAELVKGSFVKPGAVVIDVGVNRNSEGKLVGDVEFAAVSKIASAITRVTGGVGPMTRAMLMKNTVKAAKLQKKD